MPTLGSLKKAIGRLFAENESVCLWWSAGADSSLLLQVMLETGKSFGILRFDDGWSREQKQAVDAVIMDKNLMVYSFPANAHLLVGEGDEYGLVSQYAVDGFGNTAMLVRDLVHDDKRCAIDIKLEKAKQKAAPIEWGKYIWGTRRADRFWLSGDKPLVKAREWTVGIKPFAAPLFDWSSTDVQRALKTYGVTEFSSDTDIHCCHSCLKTTEKVWCPKAQAEIDGVGFDKAGNTALIREILR